MSKKVKKPKSKTRKIIEWIFTGIFLAILAFVCVVEINGLVSKKDNYNVPVIFGKYQSCVVLTNSMVPKYKVNSAILVKKYSVDELIDAYDRGEEVDLTFHDSFKGGISTDVLNDNELEKYAPGTYTHNSWRQVSNTNAIMTHRMCGYQKDEVNGIVTFAVHGINAGQENDKYPINQFQVFQNKQLIGRVIGVSTFLGALATFATSWWGLLILLLIPALYLVITSVIDLFKAFDEPNSGSNNSSGGGNSSENINKDDPLSGLSEKERERLKKEMLEELLNKKGK